MWHHSVWERQGILKCRGEIGVGMFSIWVWLPGRAATHGQFTSGGGLNCHLPSMCRWTGATFVQPADLNDAGARGESTLCVTSPGSEGSQSSNSERKDSTWKLEQNHLLTTAAALLDLQSEVRTQTARRLSNSAMFHLLNCALLVSDDDSEVCQ